MSHVVSLFNLREDGGDLFEELSPAARAAKILADELPYICNDLAMLLARPFRLVWDPSIETASTDCIAEVRLAPWPFIEGQREVGYGIVYHESGHIRQSPYGAKLLERAHKEGGQTLQHILNIIIDRKDDYGTAVHAPGFAATLRSRMVYLASLSRRRIYKGLETKLGKEDFEKAIRKVRPADVYEDFFFAAKWHKSPRFRATTRAMKLLRQKRLTVATPEALLWMARKVREILGEVPGSQSGEGHLNTLYASTGIECGGISIELDPELAKALNVVMSAYVASLRKSGLNQLLRQLKTAGVILPGQLSVGLVDKVPVRKVPAARSYDVPYRELLMPVESHVVGLVRKLKRVDSPSEFTLYGREEGDLDLSASARIATGLGGCYSERVVERDIDAAIHLAFDSSGSMGGNKLTQTKRVGVLFCEAMLALKPMCEGRLWSFNSDEICDYGEPSRNSGFVSLECSGGNSDTHMLAHVGRELARSQKRRKILLVLCDDGPDSIERVKELSRQLRARGIIVIHLLFGVHGTPDIYPIELPYVTVEELLVEFPDLLENIIKHLR